MSTKLDVDVNQFPGLTWNFLKINRTHLDSAVESDAGFTAVVSNDDLTHGECTFSSLSSEEKEVKTGLGQLFDAEFDSFSKKTKTLRIDVPGCKASCCSRCKVKIEFEHHDGEAKAKDIVLHAQEGSRSQVILVLKGAELNEGVLGARLRVIAEEGASVKICAVNLLGKKAVHFFSLGSLVKDNAHVDFTEIQLGGSKVYSGNFTALNGYKLRFSGHTGYIAREDSEFDFNYVSHQEGRESESSLSVDGVCDGSARKTWRGTIDFIKGCADSKGDEQENVLLLSPKVINKTLPVILCDEEAVEGRHGASIGRLDSDMLFYMQSRGVDENEARRLMVTAKIRSVCRHAEDPEITESVEAFLSGL